MATVTTTSSGVFTNHSKRHEVRPGVKGKVQQDRVAELSSGHEHPAKDQTGGAGVAALHPVHMHKAKDRRLQHNRRGDAPGTRGRPGHHGDVLRPSRDAGVSRADGTAG